MASAQRTFEGLLDMLNTVQYKAVDVNAKMIAASIVTLAHAINNHSVDFSDLTDQGPTEVEGMSQLAEALNNLPTQPLMVDGMDRVVQLLEGMQDS